MGGHVTEGLGGSDIDNHRAFQNSPAVGGLALDFYRRVADHYGRRDTFERALQMGSKRPDLWTYESKVAEQVFLAWLREAGVELRYGRRLAEEVGAVAKTGATITSLHLESGEEVSARQFVDATYEGDLLAAAGVSFVVGRESTDRYGEASNGIRCENVYRQFEVPVDPFVVPGDSTSGLIHTVSGEPLGECGASDDRIQASCFRMCLTRDSTNRLPFTKPTDYHPEWYEIYRRYLRAGGQLYRPRARLPNGKTDLGAWHDLSHNLYGFNHHHPTGSYATRDSIYGYHRSFTAGLFYFLSHDPAVPDDLRREWSGWGLAADEFTDNGGWPRTIYLRDGRRLVSGYVMTEHHARLDTPLVAADPVAVAFWPPDVHHTRRIVRAGRAYNEGFIFGGDAWRPFGIAYRALVPKPDECTNLITPTCPSSSHIAYGAIRLEWTFMALGEAAGAAVSIALDRGLPVAEVPYGELKAKLLTGGQVIKIGLR